MCLSGFDSDRATVDDEFFGICDAKAGLFLLLSGNQLDRTTGTVNPAASIYLELYKGVGHPILVELDLDIACAVYLHSF